MYTNVKQRNNAIDFYKLWFSLWIMMRHSVYLVPDSSVVWAKGGSTAVEFFFIVSGYLMVYKVCRGELPDAQPKSVLIGRDTFSFVVGKVKKIFPYYVFAYVLSFLCIHTLTEMTWKQVISDIAYSVIPFFFLEQTGIYGVPVVAALWYMSAMLIVMMVIYPILLKNGDFFLWVVAPLVAAMGYGLNYQLFGGLTANGIYPNIVRTFAGLCLGACCYNMAYHLSKIRLTKARRILATLAELASFIAANVMMWTPLGNRYTLLIMLFAVIAILSFSRASYITELWDRVNTKFLAEFSAALYLCHCRLTITTVRTFPIGISYERKLFRYVILSLACSLLCVFTVNVYKKLRARNKNLQTL